MCDQQRLRPACAYAQSDQSLCLSLEYSLTVKLPTEHHLEAAQACLSLHMSKTHNVGNHVTAQLSYLSGEGEEESDTDECLDLCCDLDLSCDLDL